MPLETVEIIPDENDADVKGVFFPEATQKDFEDQQAEDSGMKAWLDRLRNL